MPGWHEITLLADLEVGRPTRAVLEDEHLLLLRTEDQVFALGNACTHQGAPLDKGVMKIAGSQKTVTCPAHGSMFDLGTGRVMRPPAAKPAQVYDVKVENGRVFVRPRAGS